MITAAAPIRPIKPIRVILPSREAVEHAGSLLAIVSTPATAQPIRQIDNTTELEIERLYAPLDPELYELLGEDATEQQLDTARFLIRTSRQIEALQRPKEFTHYGCCTKCGVVPLPAGSPLTKPLAGCPWCHGGEGTLIERLTKDIEREEKEAYDRLFSEV